jgi:AcrR family transcriptional regulator
MSTQATVAEDDGSRIPWPECRGGSYRIAEVAALTRVPTSSIHHYLRLGLIPEPQRRASNQFIYDDRHIRALAIIRSLRAGGRTLEEIRVALPKVWASDADCVETAVDAYFDSDPRPTGPASRLIDAAISAFAGRGYGDVTIGDLCERAGVAKATFYRHFPNKNSVFLAAAMAVVERAVVGFERELRSGPVPNPAATFATYLRPGLPVLFELAKQAIATEPGAPPAVAAAVPLFVDFAERVGRLVRDGGVGGAGGDDADADAKSGALVVLLALVDIFNQVFQAHTAIDAPTAGTARG